MRHQKNLTSFNLTSLNLTAAFIGLSVMSFSAIGLSGCGGSSGGSSGGAVSVSPPPPPPPPPSTEFTITGQASKGLLKNARVFVFESNSIKNEDPTIIYDGTTNANGQYNLTIDTEQFSDLGEYLFVSVVLNGAVMKCDSPVGCGDGVAFGADYTIKAEDNNTPRLEPYYAVIPTPQAGTTITANINPYTNFTFSVFDLLVSQNSPMQFTQQDYVAAQTRSANFFSLDDIPHYTLPYIDITQTITSDDSNAIKAAILAGGYAASLFNLKASTNSTPQSFELAMYQDYLGFTSRNGEMWTRLDPNHLPEISLENIFNYALSLEDINDTNSNAYDTALQSIKDYRAEILKSAIGGFTGNGITVPATIPLSPIPEPINYTANHNSAAPIQLDFFTTVTTLTYRLEDGDDSDFFTLNTSTGQVTPVQAFDCNNPQDQDMNNSYSINVWATHFLVNVMQTAIINIVDGDGVSCVTEPKSATSLQSQYDHGDHKTISDILREKLAGLQ